MPVDPSVPFQKTPTAEGVGSAMPADQAQKKASPEDQAKYEETVIAGMQLLHNPETRDSVVERLSTGDPTDAIADVVFNVVSKIEADARKQGIKIPDHVILAAGEELFGQTLLIGKSAGAFDMSPEEIEMAMYKAVEKYLVAKDEQGELDLTGKEALMPYAEEQAAQFGRQGMREPPPKGPQGGAPMAAPSEPRGLLEEGM